MGFEYELTKFNMGGYKFDDWSLLKELYVPADVSSGTDKTLHLRGRESLPHHLQHYVIPTDKVFLALAVTNVQISADNMGLFGTGLRFGRYPESHQQPGDDDPGAPLAWDGVTWPFGQYWCTPGVWGSLVIHGGIIYECKLTHSPDVAKEPGTPGGAAYWIEGSEWKVDWEVGKDYFFNELELVEVEGFTGAYMCMVDHTSHADNKPCSGVDWDTIWNPGDEYTPELSSQYGFKNECLTVGKGITRGFSSEVLAWFDGSTNIYGRWIDAMTDGGTMKAGACLYGIEVDA